jgi:multisubunit Na+/H+ antiporter MnhG subunit
MFSFIRRMHPTTLAAVVYAAIIVFAFVAYALAS